MDKIAQITKQFNVTGASSDSINNIPNSYSFITILNNSPYAITVKANGSTLFNFPIYTVLTIPINSVILQANTQVNYTVSWAGTGAGSFTMIFSENNLGLNQSLVAASGQSSVIITGDTAGLATTAKQDTTKAVLDNILIAATPAGTNVIGKVGIDQSTPGTSNGVQVNAALPAGTNNIGIVSIDQTGGINNKVIIGGYFAMITETVNLTGVMQRLNNSMYDSGHNQLLLQSDPDNTENIFVGDSLKQCIKLLPGATLTIPIQNLNLVCVRAATSSAVLNYMLLS